MCICVWYICGIARTIASKESVLGEEFDMRRKGEGGRGNGAYAMGVLLYARAQVRSCSAPHEDFGQAIERAGGSNSEQ